METNLKISLFADDNDCLCIKHEYLKNKTKQLLEPKGNLAKSQKQCQCTSQLLFYIPAINNLNFKLRNLHFL